ncbi:MAG: hypothetical protein JSR77_18695 [Planctomycetes bacterium]|nr:hypothetical protein [Planctomycetota bacterium]
MWEPIVQTGLGALIAVASGFGSHWLSHQSDKSHARRSVAAALAGEIGSLCAVARRRRYLDGAEYFLKRVRETGQPIRLKLSASANYMVIFDANAGAIGHLAPDLALDVVKFYVQIKSLLEDARPDGPEPPDRANAEHMLNEQIALLRETLCLGDALVQRLRNVAK